MDRTERGAARRTTRPISPTNFASSSTPRASSFTRVWNGHAIQLRTQVDDMPAFEGKLSKDEVWAVVEYLKVLRTPRR